MKIQDALSYLRSFLPNRLTDPEHVETYNLIKDVSNNFTNGIGMEDIIIDLAQSLQSLYDDDNEDDDSSSSDDPLFPTPAPAGSTTKPPKPPRDSELAKLEAFARELAELIRNLHKTKPKLELDQLQVQAIADQVRRDMKKIGLDDLDPALRKRLEEIIKIQYVFDGREGAPITNDDKKIPAFQKIMDDMVMRNNAFLVGGAGTGKTTLAKKISRALGLGEPVVLTCNQYTAPLDIVGGQTIDGYQAGNLEVAWRDGKVLVLDEMPKLDPNTAGVLNEALALMNEPKAEAFLTNGRGERIQRHDNFRVIATGNIYPNAENSAYGGNFKQDLSLLDRFSGAVYWIEGNPNLEKSIIQNDYIWNIANTIRNVIEENKYEAQMSLRWMITARKAWALEKARINDPKPTITAEEGKTFLDTLDSYLDTFLPVQREILKQRIDYPNIKLNYKRLAAQADPKP